MSTFEELVNRLECAKCIVHGVMDKGWTPSDVLEKRDRRGLVDYHMRSVRVAFKLIAENFPDKKSSPRVERVRQQIKALEKRERARHDAENRFEIELLRIGADFQAEIGNIS